MDPMGDLFSMFNFFKWVSESDNSAVGLEVRRAPFASTAQQRSRWVKLCTEIDDVSAFQGFLACWMIADYKAKPSISKMVFIFERVLGEAYDYKTFYKKNKQYQIDLSPNAPLGKEARRIGPVVMSFTMRQSPGPMNRRQRGGTVVLPRNLFDDAESVLLSGALDNGVRYYQELESYLATRKSQAGNNTGFLKGVMPWLRQELSAAGFNPADLGL